MRVPEYTVGCGKDLTLILGIFSFYHVKHSTLYTVNISHIWIFCSNYSFSYLSRLKMISHQYDHIHSCTNLKIVFTYLGLLILRDIIWKVCELYLKNIWVTYRMILKVWKTHYYYYYLRLLESNKSNPIPKVSV